MKTYLSQKDYDFIYSRVPRVCVDLVILSTKGLLLSKRKIEPNYGMWHLPGGRIFIHEKVADAVQRIAKNELNVKVQIDSFIGYIEYLKEIRKATQNHSLSLVFKLKVKSGTLKGNSQTQEIKFFSKLPKNIIPEQLVFLKQQSKLKLFKKNG